MNRSLQSILKKPILFFTIILADIFFVYSYGGIASFFQDKIAEFFAKMSPSLASLAKEDIFWTSPISLFTQTTVWPYTKQVILNSVLLYFSLLANIILIQGLAWWLTTRFFKTTKPLKYIKRFALITLVLLTVYSILTVIDFGIAVQKTIAEQLKMPVSDLPQYVITTLLILTLIYAALCFSAQNFILKYLPIKTIILIVLMFLVLQALLASLKNISQTLELNLGFVMLFIAIAFSRVCLVEAYHDMDA